MCTRAGRGIGAFLFPIFFFGFNFFTFLGALRDRPLGVCEVWGFGIMNFGGMGWPGGVWEDGNGTAREGEQEWGKGMREIEGRTRGRGEGMCVTMLGVCVRY